ncbi:MAG TPA: hypothetical protein VLF18_21570 [Tahibacter sp.]|uniref:hypothetical protein n=1 Tax=Tahibacter sp. TaxID=2056211 RepID=UPI002C5B8E3D|nr:hypothetical protein [Tahibacter sp.]HSX62781.1 hypothetical protein [Tahibacter sp.]
MVVGAEIEAEQAIDLLRACRDHDDRQVGELAPADVQAVLPGSITSRSSNSGRRRDQSAAPLAFGEYPLGRRRPMAVQPRRSTASRGKDMTISGLSQVRIHLGRQLRSGGAGTWENLCNSDAQLPAQAAIRAAF